MEEEKKKKQGYYPGKYIKELVDKAKEKKEEIKDKILELQQERRLSKAARAEEDCNDFLVDDDQAEGDDFGLGRLEARQERGRSPTPRGRGSAAETTGEVPEQEQDDGQPVEFGDVIDEDDQDSIISEDGNRAVRAKVADCSVSSIEVRSLAVNYHVYCTCLVEKQRECSKRIERLLDGGCGSFDLGRGSSWDFPVTDITGDIVISVYGKPVRAVVPDRFVGKVIIPLSRLYRDASVMELLAAGTTFEFFAWLTIYPLEERKVHFEPVVEGFPKTGLQQPSGGTSALGQVRLRVSLTLPQGMSVVMAGALNPPLRPIGQFEPQDFDPKHLKNGANRIKRIVETIKSVAVMKASLQAWDRPVVSGLVFAWYAYSLLVAQPWQYPFLVVLLYVSLSFAFPYEQPDVAPVVWNHEIVRDPSLPKTLPDKLKKLPVLLGAIQRIINKISFFVERIILSLNWTDPIVSVLCSCWALLLGCFVSLAQLTIQTICAHTMPLGTWLFLLGLPWFFPTVSDAVEEYRHRAASDLKRWRYAPSENQPSTTTSNSTRQRLKALYSQVTTFAKASVATSSAMFWNSVDRIPDSKAVMHRRIAATQEVASSRIE